jgi:two-component system, chemotaxis family, chemotaxis protein CheY
MVMDTNVPVLVVEDSSTMTRIISSALEKLGFTDIDTAQDGQSGLDQLRNKRYGLILSDWEMQPVSGDQFLREVRKDPANSRIPIVVITAQSSRGAAWLAGAKAYLSKPFSDRELESAIKVALE